jgi:hypothetical protein
MIPLLESRQLLEYVVPHHLTGQIEPTLTSIQYQWGQSGPAHPPSASCKMVTKNLCSMQDVHKTSFFVVFQCPVANHNVLAMQQASTCISIYQCCPVLNFKRFLKTFRSD